MAYYDTNAFLICVPELPTKVTILIHYTTLHSMIDPLTTTSDHSYILLKNHQINKLNIIATILTIQLSN